uniref:(northern house mosquito) hypothetical protein n=1 Tax=Culex pipiens TaxID=7175 RepID=A0A8D8IFV1_CULPI
MICCSWITLSTVVTVSVSCSSCFCSTTSAGFSSALLALTEEPSLGSGVASCSWLACFLPALTSESCSVRLAFSGPGDCSGVDDAFGVPRALALLLPPPTRCGRSALECLRAGVSGAAGLAGVLVPLWDRLRSRLVELVLPVDDFGSGGFSSFARPDTPVTAIEMGRGLRWLPADAGRDRR